MYENNTKQNEKKYKFDSRYVIVKYFSDTNSYGIFDVSQNCYHGLFWTRMEAYNYIEEFGY